MLFLGVKMRLQILTIVAVLFTSLASFAETVSLTDNEKAQAASLIQAELEKQLSDSDLVDAGTVTTTGMAVQWDSSTFKCSEALKSQDGETVVGNCVVEVIGEKIKSAFSITKGRNAAISVSPMYVDTL
jgi:hypothetical protein